MGPPEAYHVGSEKSGVVKNTEKRSAQVMIPLWVVNFSPASERYVVWTYIEAARKVRNRPIFSDVGIRSLIKSGQGSTSIITSVTKLGML